MSKVGILTLVRCWAKPILSYSSYQISPAGDQAAEVIKLPLVSVRF